MLRAREKALSALSLAGALVVWVGIACTHYVTRGSDLYYQGRYIEAAHVLEKTEGRLSGASPVEQATYGLYRGATLLRLGDLAGADHWLGYAVRVSEARHGLLTQEEEQLLRESLIALRVDLDREAASHSR